MKTMIAALASASLLAAPLALSATPAMAQHSHGFSGFSHSFSRGFGGRPGFGRFGGGPGFRGFGPGFFVGGLFLGAVLADAWAWDYPYYGYHGYYGPPPYYGYDGPPPPGYGPPPPPGDQAAPQGQTPPAAQSQTPQACGSWVWDAAHAKYNWVSC